MTWLTIKCEPVWYIVGVAVSGKILPSSSEWSPEYGYSHVTEYKEWVKVKHNYIIIIICSYVVEGS